PIYTQLAADELRTRDRELSALSFQRVGAEFERVFELGDGAMKLSASLAVAGNFYHYADFVGLNQIAALEVSVGLTLRM
ncbi:MAG: hypothetical protein RL701_5661, partial [Pseudomonadota bacterium]